MRQPIKLLWIFFIASIYASAAPAQEIDSILQGCNECHGNNGVSTDSDIPTIAGMSWFFLDEQMRAYRDEARPCAETKYPGEPGKPAEDMCDIAKDLSDEQIEAIAIHYEEQEFVPAKQDVDLAKAAQGSTVHEEHCEQCHTEAGSVAMDDAGILAGQWMPYMKLALEEYRAGKRPEIKKMDEAFDNIGKDDVDTLVHFYACAGNAQAENLLLAKCETQASENSGG